MARPEILLKAFKARDRLLCDCLQQLLKAADLAVSGALCSSEPVELVVIVEKAFVFNTFTQQNRLKLGTL